MKAENDMKKKQRKGGGKEKAKENDTEAKQWTNEETCMLLDLFEEVPVCKMFLT